MVSNVLDDVWKAAAGSSSQHMVYAECLAMSSHEAYRLHEGVDVVDPDLLCRITRCSNHNFE